MVEGSGRSLLIDRCGIVWQDSVWTEGERCRCLPSWLFCPSYMVLVLLSASSAGFFMVCKPMQARASQPTTQCPATPHQLKNNFPVCSSVMLPLPGYDHQGRKVVFGRWGIYDPNKVSMDEVMKLGSLIFDVLLDEDEQATITGVVMAGDCTGLTLAHAMAYTPAMAKKSMVLWQVMEEGTGEERE